MVKKSDDSVGSCRPESNATNATVAKVRARTQERLGDLGNVFDAFGPDKQEPFYRTPAHSTWPQHPRKGGPRCDGPSGQRGNCGRVTRRSTADHNPQRARCEEARAGASRIAEKGSRGVGREGALRFRQSGWDTLTMGRKRRAMRRCGLPPGKAGSDPDRRQARREICGRLNGLCRCKPSHQEPAQTAQQRQQIHEYGSEQSGLETGRSTEEAR
jgi:hypothetical protein